MMGKPYGVNHDQSFEPRKHRHIYGMRLNVRVDRSPISFVRQPTR